jgi:hypothetical protein
MFKSKFVALLLILLLLCVSQSPFVSAQAIEEADPRADLTQAFAAFVKAGNYHFTSNSSSLNRDTDLNKQVKTVYYAYSIEGDVLSNSEYHDTIIVKTGVDQQDADAKAALGYERIVTGGKLYLRPLPTDHWLEVPSSAFAQHPELNTLMHLTIPSRAMINDSLVESVTDGGIEAIDGVDAQRYDLKINGLGVLLASAGLAADQLRLAFRSVRPIAASTFDVSEQVWVGVQDKKVYRSTGQSHTVIPYVTYGIQDAPPYDLESRAQFGFTISYPTQPIVITQPENAELYQ